MLKDPERYPSNHTNLMSKNVITCYITRYYNKCCFGLSGIYGGENLAVAVQKSCVGRI